MRETLLIIALLTLPKDAKVPPGWHDAKVERRLREFALREELTCEWELCGQNDSILPHLRFHFGAVSKFPRLSDIPRFPVTWLVEQNRAHLRDRMAYYGSQMDLGGHHGEVAGMRHYEASKRFRAYDLILEAQDRSDRIYKRRESLHNLRELLGPEDYASGRLPAPDL